MSELIEQLTPIHATALIDPSAEIEPGARIGPYSIIGPRARIGAGTRIYAHVIIEQDTQIGRDCEIFHGAALGGPPQDTKYKGEPTHVVIGDENIIREYVTIHRATGEGNVTRIGDQNMLMAYVHIGHNCEIGNRVTLASYAGISGHVTIEDEANFGGIVGIHQYCRIGTLSMIGAVSGVNQDIPPYMMAVGRPADIVDLNIRGLHRAGVAPSVRRQLRDAFKLLYRSSLNRSQALETIETEIEKSPELEHLLMFLRSTREGHKGRGNNPSP